ncbi:MAG: cytochrome c family protein [Pseudomonadota bacterium]
MNTTFSNMVMMALLGCFLFVMVLGVLVEAVFHAGGGHGHGDEVAQAYPIEVPEKVVAVSDVADPVTEGPSLAMMMAEAKAEDGESVFRQCSSCHSIEAGGKNGIGPNLHNIVGAQVAARDGFNYSNALQEVGGEWTYEKLDGFLTNPKGYVSGTKMSFRGLKKPTQRARVIQYLRSYTENPPPLPEIEDSAEGE